MTNRRTSSKLRAETTKRAFRGLNRVVIPLVKAGIGSPLPFGAGIVVVETTGRNSGLAREVPLLAFRAGSKVVTSTVRPNSQWAKNAAANSSVAVWVGGRKRTATADVDDGPLTVAAFSLD